MTVEEMEDTLTRLGMETVSTRGDEVQSYCPAHKDRTGHEDRNPSFWINSDTGAFICFSCQFKGNVYSLINYVSGIDYDKAKEWFDSPSLLVSRFNRITEEKRAPIEEPTLITESMLSAFVDPPAEALASRGLTINASRAYELCWDARNENWIIPIRDARTEKLLGWQEKGYSKRYFNNTPAKMKKSNSLFGYRQYVGGDMIVVESPLDVVRLASIGITGGVALYGALISLSQLTYIKGADRVIFALDNDDAGRNSSKDMIKVCREMSMEAWFFNYNHTDMKDIGGMSLDEVRLGISNARHSVHGLKAVL
jgi:DNA primase